MPLRHTRGFKSVLHKETHFRNHAFGLGILTEGEYESFADEFLGLPPASTVRQFVRSWNGDVVRYDEIVDVFGILDGDRFIKTCYRPDPFFHGFATNLEYYLDEESKA